MSVITRGNFSKFLWPGINSTFGMTYKQFDNGAQYKKIFAVHTSKQAFEEDVALSGLGLVEEKPEGQALTYDTMKQGFITRYTHTTFGRGFIITMEEIDDNLYPKVAAERPANLAMVFGQTKEIICANVLNRAFSGAYLGGDLVALCSGSHPLDTGTSSNLLSPGADLSEAALEQALINIADFVDNRGNKINMMPQKLVVANGNQFAAKRIFGNPERPDTADRDINAMYQMGSIPQGYIVNNYLTDADAWFITTNCSNGLKFFQRKALEFSEDNDYDTKNAKYGAVERYSVGWSDWRGVYGSEGV